VNRSKGAHGLVNRHVDTTVIVLQPGQARDSASLCSAQQRNHTLSSRQGVASYVFGHGRRFMQVARAIAEVPLRA